MTLIWNLNFLLHFSMSQHVSKKYTRDITAPIIHIYIYTHVYTHIHTHMYIYILKDHHHLNEEQLLKFTFYDVCVGHHTKITGSNKCQKQLP